MIFLTFHISSYFAHIPFISLQRTLFWEAFGVYRFFFFSWQLPEPSNSPRNLENWKTYQNRTLPKKEFFGGKWREYGRNNGKYDRLGKSLQERARLNTIPWDFPRGEIILGVLEIPCTPQKSKWAAASWKKTINTECFPFHTHSHRVFFGSIWRECERNVGKYEKMEICRKEPVMKMMVEHHFAGIPKFFLKIFFCSTI